MNYKFKCLQCGKRFKTEAALAAHEKAYHQRHEKIKKRAEKRKHEAHQLEKKLPGKRTNVLALIIFLLIVALFIYFVYFRS